MNAESVKQAEDIISKLLEEYGDGEIETQIAIAAFVLGYFTGRREQKDATEGAA